MVGVVFLLGGGGHQQDLSEVLCSSSFAAQLDVVLMLYNIACISFRLTPLITAIIVPRLSQ